MQRVQRQRQADEPEAQPGKEPLCDDRQSRTRRAARPRNLIAGASSNHVHSTSLELGAAKFWRLDETVSMAVTGVFSIVDFRGWTPPLSRNCAGAPPPPGLPIPGTDLILRYEAKTRPRPRRDFRAPCQESW